MIALIYLFGCILAYGRMNAGIFELRQKTMDSEEFKQYFIEKQGIKPEDCFPSHVHNAMDALGFYTMLIMVASWIGFIFGTFIYFYGNESYFFRFKNWN